MEQEYESEIKRGNFVKALYLSKDLSTSEVDVNYIAERALWEVSGIGRNFYATKRLAQELGYTKEELKNILVSIMKKEEKSGNKKMLGPCYDYNTGRYLSFEKWLEYLLKEWNKIN